MKKVIVLMFSLIVLGTLLTENVQGFNQTCSNSVLSKTKLIQLEGMVNDNLTMTENENCTYGCASNGVECDSLASESLSFGLIPITLLIVAALFAFLTTRTEGHYQILFLGLTLIFLIIPIGLLASYPYITSSQVQGVVAFGYHSLIIASIVIVFIVILTLFIVLAQNKFKKKVV